MLEVKIPAEIRDYKGKIILGLSVRKLISIIAGLAVGIPLGVFGSKVIPPDYLMWLVILSVAPIFLWGFIKYKDMMFEKYSIVLFRYHFLPQIRVYEDVEENYFVEINATLSERELLRQRSERGEVEDDYEEEDEESE